jgi:hypothetical protein
MSIYLIIGGVVIGVMVYYGKFTFKVEFKNNLNREDDNNK